MSLPTLKPKFLVRPITNLHHVITVIHSCMYLFSVNFDALNAVLGIDSIYFGDVTNFIPDYRNFMTALPIYESLRTVKHLNFSLNFFYAPAVIKMSQNSSAVQTSKYKPI